LDFLEILFPISGVKTNILVPFSAALVISFFTSMGGVSGAFLLLPFQVSFLNFTSPSVSSTNLLYNVVAIPGGVYRYIKEGRMVWALTSVVMVGTLPGIFLGYFLRVAYLPDPETFQLFAGIVLFGIGIKLISELARQKRLDESGVDALEEKFERRRSQLHATQQSKIAAGLPPEAVVKTLTCSLRKIEYEFWGQAFSFNTIAMFALASAVGIVGGTYGIGGGAIIAPICVAVFRLPVYTVAGATLLATFLTSIAGVVFYTTIPVKQGFQTSPDWILGLILGAGGFAGTYFGARCQKFVPQKPIKIMLGLVIFFTALKYIIQYF
jgi:uncharacterized membrane protein YfcA